MYSFPLRKVRETENETREEKATRRGRQVREQTEERLRMIKQYRWYMTGMNKSMEVSNFFYKEGNSSIRTSSV